MSRASAMFGSVLAGIIGTTLVDNYSGGFDPSGSPLTFGVFTGCVYFLCRAAALSKKGE